jgi:hypothetical protein
MVYGENFCSALKSSKIKSQCMKAEEKRRERMERE